MVDGLEIAFFWFVMNEILKSVLGYIDPGTGSLLLQMLIAGAVGALAFFRRSIFRFFGRPKAKENPSGEVKAAPQRMDQHP